MKQILDCIISFFLSLFFFLPCNTNKPFEYPTGTSSVVKQNTEALFLDLNASREEALKTAPADSTLRVFSINKGSVLDTARTIDSVGVKEIVEMRIEVEIYDSYGCYYAHIKDIDGKSYYMRLAEGGGVSYILEGDKNGKST